MNVELNEAELQAYAEQRMKQKIEQKVTERLKEIEWYKSIDHAVFDAVESHITEERVAKILGELDRQQLIDGIAKYLAAALAEKLIQSY